MEKKAKGINRNDSKKSNGPTEKEHLNDVEEQPDVPTGCAMSSLFLLICILTLLVILFSAALIYMIY